MLIFLFRGFKLEVGFVLLEFEYIFFIVCFDNSLDESLVSYVCRSNMVVIVGGVVGGVVVLVVVFGLFLFFRCRYKK